MHHDAQHSQWAPSASQRQGEKLLWEAKLLVGSGLGFRVQSSGWPSCRGPALQAWLCCHPEAHVQSGVSPLRPCSLRGCMPVAQRRGRLLRAPASCTVLRQGAGEGHR